MAPSRLLHRGFSALIVAAAIAAPGALEAAPSIFVCSGTGAVCQDVSVEARGAGGAVLAQDAGHIAGASFADINADILAEVQAAGARGFAAAGRFGNIGLRGEIGGPVITGLTLNATVESALFVNTAASPRHASAQFIIDGGRMLAVGGTGSSIDFALALTVTLFDENGDLKVLLPGSVLPGSFFADAILTQTSDNTWSLSGSGLRATIDPNRPNQAIIPLSLQTFDIGDIPGGWTLALKYQAEFVTTIVGFSEAFVMEFSDPFSVDADGGEFPVVTFSDIGGVAVPAPAPLGLILTGVGLLFMVRRRQRRR